MSAKKLASVGAQNYCEMRKTGAALTMTCQSGTRVYRRGTGSGWPPLGAATGANEPHTQLGLVV